MLRLEVYLRYNCMFAYLVLSHTDMAGKRPDILLKDTSGLALTCGVVLRLSVVLLPLSIPGNVPASHFKTPAFELQIVLMSL